MLTTTDWRTTNGISRAQLLDYARWHIRSLACQHGALVARRLGQHWQSALWAVTAGQAGWLLWDELNEQERGLRRRPWSSARPTTRRPAVRATSATGWARS